MASTQPQQRKPAFRSPVTWLIVLGIALAGGAYLLYRRSQSSAATGTSTTGTSTDTSTGTDYSGQIATLQTEIMDLQSSGAKSSSSSTPAVAKPGAPQNLKLTGNNSTSVQVSWDLPGGVADTTWSIVNHEGTATGTVVDRFDTNNSVANLAGADAKPAGLKPGTRYVVVIQGQNSAGTGPSASFGYTTKAAAAKKAATPAKTTKKPAPKTAAHSTKKAA